MSLDESLSQTLASLPILLPVAIGLVIAAILWTSKETRSAPKARHRSLSVRSYEVQYLVATTGIPKHDALRLIQRHGFDRLTLIEEVAKRK